MVIKFQRFPVAPWIAGSEEWGRGFEPLIGDFLRGGFGRECACGPRLNVNETKDEILLHAELPGVKKEDLKIVVHDGILTISGERKARPAAEGSRWIRNEIGTGAFSRSVELPAQVDAEKITATIADGILRVVLSKAEQARPREITIR